MNTLAKTVVQASRSELGSDLESLNETLTELGWTASGSTAPQYSRHFEAQGIRLNLYQDSGSWFIDVLFKEVYPADADDLGYEAVIAVCEAEEGFFRHVMGDLVNQVTARGVDVERGEELGIDREEFILLAEWKIGHLPLILGIAYIDTGLPVSVMARFPAGHQHDG
ncbi:hypothetical protein [Streptomyces sp. YIM S03343]